MSASQYKSSQVKYKDHEDTGGFISQAANSANAYSNGAGAGDWYIVSRASYTEGAIYNQVINAIKSKLVSEHGSSISNVEGLQNALYCNGTGYPATSVSYSTRQVGSHEYVSGHHTARDYWTDSEGEEHWFTYEKDDTSTAYEYNASVSIGGIVVYTTGTYNSNDSGANNDNAYNDARNWAEHNIHYAVKVPPEYPVITEVNFGMQVQVIPGDVKIPIVGLGKDNPDAAYVSVELAGKDIEMYLGGNIWESVPDNKTGNGIKSDSSTAGAGIEVTLVDNNNGSYVSIMTDSKGNYGFKKLNPMHKYYVKFRYNGMQYIQASGSDTIADPGSGVTATETDRATIDSRFATINASNGNYDGQSKKAFGYYTKLKSGEEYVGWSNVVENGATNTGALRYCDALYVLKEACKSKTEYNLTSKKTMDSTYCDITKKTEITYADYEGALKGGIGNISDASSVWTYMMDTLVTSKTNKTYPVENKFVLEEVGDNSDSHLNATVLGVRDVYRTDQDEARRVDYGIKLREISDLALQKDVYKSEVIVNGKQQTYYYGKKNTDANWEIEARETDSLYNGEQSYGREIRKSEYLYDGSSSGSSDIKNLQVYVTYRIAVKNQGMVSTNVDEIVDYFDSDYYEYASGSSITQTNTFIGDGSGNKNENLSVGYGSQCSSSKSSVGPYTAIYLSGLPGLNPGEVEFAYITFKVKIDDSTGKIKINEDLQNGNLKRGDRNIAEINKYTTGSSKGIVDVDSNPGNLSNRDLDSEGDIITDRNSAVNNRWEDDTDKAPNVIVYIPKNDTDMLNLNGYVYEDARTDVKDGAVVGNGKYNSSDGDTKINGVTVELVELIQDVDQDGLSLGTYSGEHVWSSTTYKLSDLKADPTVDLTRYYSGKKLDSNKVYSQVILSGDSGILQISPTELSGDGAYGFTSVPTGDFFIRYVYGDTTQTTLTSGSNDVNDLLGKLKDSDISKDNNINVKTTDTNYGTLSDGFISTSGLNAKSYNGQDYKSTVYQSGISQSGSYNGHISYTTGSSDGNATINGYTQYDTQNYTNSDGKTKNNGTDKTSMYYYDIDASENGNGASDAKDVYAYRQNSDNWSTGYNGSTLVNNRAEILASFENVGTYTYSNDDVRAIAQKSMVQSLMNNTRMVAQTGLINTEVERNRRETGNQADALKNKSDLNNSGTQGSENSLPYTISDIDLGLVERPESQLKLTKKVTNFKITLANGQSLFDTKQSVNNLYYAKHYGHIAQYDDEATDKSQPNKLNPRGFRLSNVQTSKNSKKTPELIQGYIDDELMEGSTLNVEYTLSIENVGEIDYLDKQFYYTGKTNNASENNMSRTDASTIIDYVSNMIKYDTNYQNDNTNWKINTPADIYKVSEKSAMTLDSLNKELVNRQYYDKVAEYNTILTTRDLSVKGGSSYISNQKIDNNGTIKTTTGLLPECIQNLTGGDTSDKTSTTTTLVLSTLLSSNSSANSLVYNNLAEVVETANSQGRRMKYSISGNQNMAEQSLGNNASTTETTSIDLVTPSEIDADSAQKILLLPPTGDDKNVIEKVIAVIAGLVIIIGAIVLIKIKVIRKNKK